MPIGNFLQDKTEEFEYYRLPFEKGKAAVSTAASDCQKGLAEFAATAANKIKIIFCRGVYLTENTAQAASVEFVCQRRTNYARSRLQKNWRKSPKGFFGNQKQLFSQLLLIV